MPKPKEEPSLQKRLEELENHIRDLEKQFDDHMTDYKHKEKPIPLEFLEGEK